MGGKKKLLIMGGIVQQFEVIEGAKQFGCHVIVVDNLLNSPGKEIADESYLISITDVESIVTLCREKKVDGVMNYCIDPGQEPYQQICERLGLPCYGTKSQFKVMANKDYFYDACLKSGIEVVTKYYIGNNFSEISIKDLKYPLVIKPVDSRASKGLTVCSCFEDLEPAFYKAQANSKRVKVMIEKYMVGPEICAKYFVCDGKIYLSSFADIFNCKIDNSRFCINGKLYPSKYYNTFLETTDNKLRNLIKQLGIKNGPLSFTGFYNKFDNLFRFFDPSFRLGGGQEWVIVANVSGVNMADCMTNFALTGSMGNIREIGKLDAHFQGKKAVALYFLAKTGRIGKICGLDRLSDFKSVIGYHLAHRENDLIIDCGTTDHVVVRVFLVADRINIIKEDIIKIQKVVKIFDEHGENMLLPNFDVNLI